MKARTKEARACQGNHADADADADTRVRLMLMLTPDTQAKFWV